MINLHRESTPNVALRGNLPTFAAMMRIFAIFIFSLLVAHAAGEKKKPTVRVDELSPPTTAHAVGASLTTAPDGSLWLSWVEPNPAAPSPIAAPSSNAGEHHSPTGEHHHGAATSDTPPNTLRFSIFDAATKKWSTPRTIATGHGVPQSAADFPQLAIDGRGRALAVWADAQGGKFTISTDRGATWSTPTVWSHESEEVEKFSLTTLADGRILAAWLDGRAKKSGGKNEQLFARVFESTTPDVLVDASVCDCCQTTLTAFPDGGALLAYRGRTEEEVRDIRTARFRGREWDESRPLNNDDWRIAACPINGPQLASDGGRIAAAWFTAADNDPRVLASFSPDAGARFLLPLRLDRGKPAGHVDTAILHDGALLVTWVENDGSVWLRRVTPDFTAGEPVVLAAAGATSVKTNPRLALLQDYRGGKTSAQFLIAFAGESALRTLLITVPEGELIEAEKDCDCAPTADQLQGFPIRGTIVQFSAEGGIVHVRHAELPGVFAAGTREFKVTPDVLAAVPAQPGRRFLGRVEQREGAWWLFDVRLIAEASSK